MYLPIYYFLLPNYHIVLTCFKLSLIMKYALKTTKLLNMQKYAL